MDIKIIVVTHKDYKMPQDSMYFPICVGNSIESLKYKFQPDNTGDNISQKNVTYCELTAIYWAWKNLSADYIGVSHYRRQYKLMKSTEWILTRSELERLFTDTDIVLPQPRKYMWTTIGKHYINARKSYRDIHRKDIQELRNAIQQEYPQYLPSFDCVIAGDKAHMLNMFIMKRDMFNNYCEWLFKIIDNTTERLRERKDQTRYAGALSEFLLDVWLQYNKYSYKEIELYELEKQSVIKKGINALKKRMA